MKIKLLFSLAILAIVLIILTGCPTPTKFTLKVTTSPETGLNITIGGISYESPKTVTLAGGSSTILESLPLRKKTDLVR